MKENVILDKSKAFALRIINFINSFAKQRKNTFSQNRF